MNKRFFFGVFCLLVAMGIADAGHLGLDVRVSCLPGQPSEDANRDCVVSPGDDVGCDGLQGMCPEGFQGEPVGSGVLDEVEPNDNIFGDELDYGSQRIVVPALILGNVSIGDAGWLASVGEVFEDNYVFEVTTPTTISATLEFDFFDENGIEINLDLFLIQTNPLELVDSSQFENPETFGPTELSPGTYFMLVNISDIDDNVNVAYSLTIHTEEADVGCDGIPDTEDSGEGNGTFDLPPDSGEGNGILDVALNSPCVCDPCLPWRNHGEYVSCVDHAVVDLIAVGTVTLDEAQDIVSSAARFAIGKKSFLPPECQ